MTLHDKLFSISEITLVTRCAYFQYFCKVLLDSKIEQKYSLSRCKVNVTINPLIITSSSKYQSIALTEIMFKNEANT